MKQQVITRFKLNNILLLLYLNIFFSLSAQNSYDIVIVGGTPGGIMASIAAAREGKTSVIIERTTHIGGLPANGLGATDIATRRATTGLFKDFVDRNKNYYVKNYGADSQQVRDCSDGYYFEPSVAEQTFWEMIGEYQDKITIIKNRQFDADPANLVMKGSDIISISVTNRDNNQKEIYLGKVFIDATYEGDLGAAAVLPYHVGRESKEEFGEIGAGKIYRYWNASEGNKMLFNDDYEGYESEGSTFAGDNAVQAYNYRLCLTNDKENQRTIERPKNYNRADYISLIDDVWTGRNTNVKMLHVTEEMLEANKDHIAKGNASMLPGDNWGISKIVNSVTLPNRKVDANNQHDAFISTDLPEENWPWPTASWNWRDKFAQRLKDYVLGLIWFVQNDEDLPTHFKEECRKWGLSVNEYVDNGNFPRQVYVREGRRLEGMHFFTAHDALPVTIGHRPPIFQTSITASHYPLDSHAVLKREEGRVHLDGLLSYDTEPYTVPYGVIIPKTINNLLFPVPVSGSHIGFSTLRMEPCWMALGEAAGVAASLVIDEDLSVRDIDISNLQETLIDNNATLIYYKDIDQINQEDLKMLQFMGVRSYIPEWFAALDEAMRTQTKNTWEQMSGVKIPHSLVSRKEALYYIYNQIRNKTSIDRQ